MRGLFLPVRPKNTRAGDLMCVCVMAASKMAAQDLRYEKEKENDTLLSSIMLNISQNTEEPSTIFINNLKAIYRAPKSDLYYSSATDGSKNNQSFEGPIILYSSCFFRRR